MFNSRNLLIGLVAASVSFGGENDWMAAFARNLRSERHLSDQEIQSLINDFQLSNGEVNSRVDRRTEYERNQINQFVSAWQKADPLIAPFLGVWTGYEESLHFYPSTTRGQVCVVLQYLGDRQTQRLLNVGKISGGKLITDGELGKRVFVRRNGKLQRQSTSLSPMREVEYVGMFGRVGSRNDFYAYVFPGSQLRQDEYYINRLTKLGCTAQLPVINLNPGESVSNKHPAEATVLDFYSQYFSRGAVREYPILNLNRDKFTSNFYKQLVRGLRINDLDASKGINYDPFGNSQSSTFSFQVGAAVVNGDRAEVPVTMQTGLRPPGQPNPIKVIVVKNGNKWQISDLVYSRPTARSLMDSLRRINSNRDFQNVPWESSDDSLPSASNTNDQNCITWDTYTSDLPPQGGRGGQWKAFKRLPPDFQNGCVLLEDNNSIDTAYVLKVGINPNPFKGKPFSSDQSVPGFDRRLIDNLDNLVKQGKALKVTWLTPTNSSIPYLRSLPPNAFLREDGMTCFSTVCMISGALSHRELSDILSISGQNRSSTPVKPTDTIAKYPTNEDFNAFEDKLQGNPESLVKLRGNQAEQRRKFQNDWKARNPNAAKFLGAWYTGDRYFYIFPSTVKGGTCVVTQDANSKIDMKIGTVLNQELRYDGGRGFFWRDRPNIIAARDSGSGSLYPIYATFGMPELSENMIGDMERQKCITSLPFEADAQYYKERGDQFAKAGNKDQAIINYRKAIELYRKQNQLAQVRNIEAQITKLGGTNTTTSPISATIVYRNSKELGLAQLTGEDKKITIAYENLVRASQGNYSIPVNTSNIEFLKKTITTLRPEDCQQLGFSCSEKQISFSDYLELKQKISKQKEVFEGSLSISDKFNAYGERLNLDTRNGGKEIAEQISKSTQKIWDEAQSKAQTRVNLSLRDKVSLALSQTKDDLLDFTASAFKTSTKTVATLVQLDEITKIVGDARTADNLNRFFGAPNYILSVQNNLKDAGQAFLQADGDKIRESMLKTAQSTIEYIDLQDSQVSKSANVIKIYSSAKDFIDQDKLLRQPQLLNDLDSFDKFYLYAAQMSKGLEIAIAGVSIPLSSSKADSLLKKVDIGNTLIFDALEFSYKNDLRRRYARLLDIYNRNQFLIIGMQSYQDYAATEVGNYLVKARTDIVSRRSDGSISVGTKGIIYPPQN